MEGLVGLAATHRLNSDSDLELGALGGRMLMGGSPVRGQLPSIRGSRLGLSRKTRPPQTSKTRLRQLLLDSIIGSTSIA